MLVLVWALSAAIFFALFAFALEQPAGAAIRWFFGQECSHLMVFIVLAASPLGCAFGVFAMVPSWLAPLRIARSTPR